MTAPTEAPSFDLLLAARIRHHRLDADLTQEVLATLMSGILRHRVHTSAISKLEHAERPAKAHEVWAIATILGVELEALTGPTDPQPPIVPRLSRTALAEARVRVLEEARGWAEEGLW